MMIPHVSHTTVPSLLIFYPSLLGRSFHLQKVTLPEVPPVLVGRKDYHCLGGSIDFISTH
jgi:hypothetical protein